jgi:hypothetical protein
MFIPFVKINKLQKKVHIFPDYNELPLQCLDLVEKKCRPTIVT